MIVKPTVLILGAGASHPYGYPLGSNLIKRIVDLTAPNGGLTGLLSEPQMGVFHQRLAKSEVESIDDFLASNPDFTRLGKLCIAAALTLWGPSADNKPNPKIDWYKYLWRRLYAGALTSEQFRSNALRVITYNYDRSFERYFTRVLVNSYPDLASHGAPVAAAFLAEVIPIVHVHGTLGESEDQVLSAHDRAPFHNAGFIATAAQSIRIVHDDEPSGEYKIAHEWLAEAEVVHLLGFGFHATNLRRLDLVAQSQKRPGGWHALGGTALGLMRAEREHAERSMTLGPFLKAADSLEYLREHALLE